MKSFTIVVGDGFGNRVEKLKELFFKGNIIDSNSKYAMLKFSLMLAEDLYFNGLEGELVKKVLKAREENEQ